MSNSNTEYDVIIVGGGPAGSTAGYLLSKRGFKTLIIDKSKFPRKKLCGGLLSLKSIELCNALFDENLRPFENQDVLNYCVNHYEINYKMERIVSRKNTDLTFCFVERSVFDNFLLEKAKKAGTNVIEGERVTAVNLDTCEVKVSKGSNYKGKYIIGADGANSVVRNEFFSRKLIDKKKWRHDMATGLECYVDRKDINNDWFDHPILFFGFIKYGYAWMFPNKDKIVVGLGGLNRKNKGDFNRALKNLINALKIDPTKTYSLEGHPIPYGNFNLTPVYEDKVFLIGDAGGFIDPLFGEGLYYAMESGLFAAHSIYNSVKNNQNARKTFLDLLQLHIYPELKASKTLNNISFNPLNIKLKYHPISIIIKTLEKQFIELIHGYRSFRWFKKKKNKVEESYATFFT